MLNVISKSGTTTETSLSFRIFKQFMEEKYGEGAKGWTSDEAKGFIKVTSTPLRAYYLAHPDEER